MDQLWFHSSVVWRMSSTRDAFNSSNVNEAPNSERPPTIQFTKNVRQQERTVLFYWKHLIVYSFFQQWPCKDEGFLQMFAELNASLVWSSPICFWAQWSSRILTHTDDIMHHDGYSSGAWVGWSEQDISSQETGKGHCNLGFIRADFLGHTAPD